MTTTGPSMDTPARRVASAGLAVGGVFGMAGTFAPSAALRGLAWGLDGVALVMAGALLTLGFQRAGRTVVAAGFLVFTMGQGLVLSTAAMDLTASTPVFGAGLGLWAAGLTIVSVPRAFPRPVRVLGLVAAALLGATAAQILTGEALTPLSSPLPFYAYPFLVATLGGWIWTLLREGAVTRAD